MFCTGVPPTFSHLPFGPVQVWLVPGGATQQQAPNGLCSRSGDGTPTSAGSSSSDTDVSQNETLWPQRRATEPCEAAMPVNGHELRGSLKPDSYTICIEDDDADDSLDTPSPVGSRTRKTVVSFSWNRPFLVKNTFVHVEEEDGDSDSDIDALPMQKAKSAPAGRPTTAQQSAPLHGTSKAPVVGGATSAESVGSTLHGTGNCKPCTWFWKPGGCQNGKDCLHCHTCPEWEAQRRRKARVQRLRLAKRMAKNQRASHAPVADNRNRSSTI